MLTPEERALVDHYTTPLSVRGIVNRLLASELRLVNAGKVLNEHSFFDLEGDGWYPSAQSQELKTTMESLRSAIAQAEKGQGL